jgi:hypothetical protein
MIARLAMSVVTAGPLAQRPTVIIEEHLDTTPEINFFPQSPSSGTEHFIRVAANKHVRGLTYQN